MPILRWVSTLVSERCLFVWLRHFNNDSLFAHAAQSTRETATNRQKLKNNNNVEDGSGSTYGLGRYSYRRNAELTHSETYCCDLVCCCWSMY